MLHIDLKNDKKVAMKRNHSTLQKKENNPQGLNAYNSLNRANRIKDLAKIIDENKTLLEKLQNTRSCYNRNKWENDFVKKENLRRKITTNSDRYCKNPYFLHSVCTKSGPNQQVYSQMVGSNYYGTISDGGHKFSNKISNRNKVTSDGVYEGNARPPRLNKKIRPYSAPKNNQFRSNKNRSKKNSRP